MNNNIRYEVAFSFLQDDEQLALEIADRIRDRLTIGIFVYSERQEELAGTDGVDKFSKVFLEESRIVVILYREGWGKTRWTRVEETAIKTRGFEEGHEFVLLVKLDGTSPPIWLPPTRLYLGFERYGIDGAAGVIETRVRDAGGQVTIQSAIEDAIKLQREIVFETESAAWHDSTEGVLGAQQEIEGLFAELQKLAEEINEKTSRKEKSSELQFSVEFQRRGVRACNVFYRGLSLQLVWNCQFHNTLRISWLDVKILEAYDATNYVVRRGEPIIVRDVRYDVQLALDRHVGWKETRGEERFFSSAQLADLLLRDLIKEIRSRPANTSYADYVELG